MLAIHGIWAHGRLSLWAEDSEPYAPLPDAPASGAASLPHPFAAAPGVLADALAELGEPVSDLVRKAAEAELTLWLPATSAGPLSSPDAMALQDGNVAAAAPQARTGRTPGRAGPGTPVSAGRVARGRVASSSAPGSSVSASTEPASRQPASSMSASTEPVGTSAGPSLLAWQVPVLSFEPAAAFALLTGPALSAQTERAVLAGSVRYLAALGEFAADLALRGRVLPGFQQSDDGSYGASWRPVLAGADSLRARELTVAMPPLCRAVSEAGEPSAAIVAEALDLLTDAAVRSRLAAAPGFALLEPGRAPSLTERWAAALTADDGEVNVGPGEVAQAAQLAFALWAWQDAAQEPPGPARTCFRLMEPPQDDRADAPASWRVEFALQSTDDPSLLLPAADIWSGSTADGWAAAGLSYPEEDLLAGLGRASRLFPELDQALQDAAPDGVELDARGALRFLRDTGPLLAGAGFGVLLPDWVRRSRLGLKLTTRSRTATAPGSVTEPRFGLSDLVDFRYELAIGDETLDPAELAELARLKVPLVRLRGQWVELDERHLDAALRFLERRGSGVMTAGDALQAGLDGAAGELPLAGIDADGWLADLLSGQADRRLEPMPTPASFRGELRPYQQRGLAWLAFLSGLGLGGVLADDMGLGKSPQTLALLQAERDAGTATGPTLLICPMSLVGNWQHEAAKFTPDLAVHVHHGTDRLAGAELTAAVGAADLVITTYGVAARDTEALAAVGWARVVCDEAQNIKNASTRQAQAVRAIPAPARVALTGTPVENRLTELWSIMQFTSPGLLGSAETFRRRFAIPIERNADTDATQQLKRLTGPFILRRLKTDPTVISDLPAKLEMKVWCNLTTEQASLYQATVDDMMSRIEAAEPGIERRGLVLATMTKLKQVCNHPAHLLGDGSRLEGRSGKLERLDEICEEIVAAGDKVLCFTQYAEFGGMLQRHLSARLGCDVYFLHGSTNKSRRDQMIADFQDGPGAAVFLLSLKAGGTGLNLTAANHVIHVDRWWNPAVEDQATDRAFRIGQRRDVQVRKFVCVGTVEERIDQLIEEKKALAETIIGTGESWLTELSVADLRAVLELSPEAVSQ
jgi:SNF2 family DNA or RNA helicase